MGRPPVWTESMQKKLVTLRMAGLKPEETLEVIGFISNGTIQTSGKNAMRRPQSILSGILSNGYGTEYPCDPKGVKARVQVFNNARRRAERSLPECPGVTGTANTVIHNTIIEEDMEDVRHHDTNHAPFDSQYMPTTLPRPEDSTLTLEYPESPAPNALLPGDHRSLYRYNLSSTGRPIRNTNLYQILKRHSYASSCISGLASLFSKFTLASQDQESGMPNLETTIPNSAPILTRTEIPAVPALNPDPASIEERQREKNTQANAALASTCCINNFDCAHRRILSYLSGVSAECNLSEAEINTRDTFGNNLLFFAARSGADYRLLLPMTDLVYNINAVNEDGQTFIFVLDPKPFQEYFIIFTLLSSLESKCFDFTRADHDGRTFLTMLACREHFSRQWFMAMTCVNSHLPKIIGTQRDASGAILLNYLFHYEYFGRCWARRLPDSVDPSWHDRVEKRQFISAMGVHGWYRSDSAAQSFGKYGVDGMTPLLREVLERLKTAKDVLLQLWDNTENNFNARDREGRTILHYSTRYSRPDVLQQILGIKSQTILVDHQDSYGFTALDYAVDHFNRSRKSSGTAQQLAKALKCIMALVDYGANMAFSPTPGSERLMTDGGKEVVIPDTEPIVLHLV